MAFKGFYKKTRLERIKILEELNLITSENCLELVNNKTLDVNIAGNITENHIATFTSFGVVHKF